MALAVFGVALAGCGTFLVGKNRYAQAPEYCYDCHYQPRWMEAHSECSYYLIRAKDGGYYYKSRNVKNTEFLFRTYDVKIVRERQRNDYEYRQKQKNGAREGNNELNETKNFIMAEISIKEAGGGISQTL